MEKVKYNIYPSLLDKFQNYLNAEKKFNKYGEYSGETIDEFCTRNENELIDAINRVPFTSEAANRGTAFNELVDALIMSEKYLSDDVSENYGGVVEDKKAGACYCWNHDGTPYLFPVALVDEFVNYYASMGAISQVYCEALINTSFGVVKLYGYIDELTPLCVHDIKTTKQYTRGKYSDHWQKYVYPYCLNECGNDVKQFEYNVTDFKQTYTEEFNYNHERDTKVLRDHVERFIMFLELNKRRITDKKIFNYRNNGQ